MKATAVIFKRNPLFAKCPSCKVANTLHRSRARGWQENFLKNFTFFKTYRCKQCGWRGYLSTLTVTSQSMKVLGFYLLLAATAGFIVLQVLKRFT
jgi:phage FluMu protein Com